MTTGNRTTERKGRLPKDRGEALCILEMWAERKDVQNMGWGWPEWRGTNPSFADELLACVRLLKEQPHEPRSSACHDTPKCEHDNYFGYCDQCDEKQPGEPDGSQAEIATVTVKDREVVSCVLKAPGLPDGSHDLFCAPLPLGEFEYREEIEMMCQDAMHSHGDYEGTVRQIYGITQRARGPEFDTDGRPSTKEGGL